jgi:hypothetical protein
MSNYDIKGKISHPICITKSKKFRSSVLKKKKKKKVIENQGDSISLRVFSASSFIRADILLEDE